MPRARPSVEHLPTRVHGHGTEADLALQRLIRSQQQLLPRLAPGVEGAGDLRAAEGAGVEEPAVLAGKGDPLGDALVDDVQAELGQAVDIGLAPAKVATLHRVVEKPEHAVAVVPVVLRRVDATLGRDRVRAARAVVIGEALDLVAQLAERCRRRRAGEARAHDQHGVAAPVGQHAADVEARGQLRGALDHAPAEELGGAARAVAE